MKHLIQFCQLNRISYRKVLLAKIGFHFILKRNASKSKLVAWSWSYNWNLGRLDWKMWLFVDGKKMNDFWPSFSATSNSFLVFCWSPTSTSYGLHSTTGNYSIWLIILLFGAHFCLIWGRTDFKKTERNYSFCKYVFVYFYTLSFFGVYLLRCGRRTKSTWIVNDSFKSCNVINAYQFI